MEGQQRLECLLYLAPNDWQPVVVLLLHVSMLPFKTVVGSAQVRTVRLCGSMFPLFEPGRVEFMHNLL